MNYMTERVSEISAHQMWGNLGIMQSTLQNKLHIPSELGLGSQRRESRTIRYKNNEGGSVLLVTATITRDLSPSLSAAGAPNTQTRRRCHSALAFC